MDESADSGGISRTQARMQAELCALSDVSQLRSLERRNGGSGEINLCSNDYLGLSTNEQLKAAVIEAVKKSTTTGSTGSRLLSGNAPQWEALEAEFAGFAGTPAALYFSSGFAANIGLLTSVLRPNDMVFSDSLNHASIIDGIRLCGARKVIYPHLDLTALEASLHSVRDARAHKVIVTESIFSMEGDHAPLLEILALARRYGAELIIDEAHATGVFGPGGRGIAALLGIENEVLAIVHMCGKALASMGAVVCSSRMVRDYLVNHARSFIFSTAMPPYMAGQISAALKLALNADDERNHLANIADLLRRELRVAGFDTLSSVSQIVPVILGDNDRALETASALQRKGFAVRAIRPPTVPPGTSRLRLSLTSRIAADDVHRLVNIMSELSDCSRAKLTAHSHA
jgi:8-amino-7-oxononanoate synthase